MVAGGACTPLVYRILVKLLLKNTLGGVTVTIDVCETKDLAANSFVT